MAFLGKNRRKGMLICILKTKSGMEVINRASPLHPEGFPVVGRDTELPDDCAMLF
jgi:hypothetical protein